MTAIAMKSHDSKLSPGILFRTSRAAKYEIHYTIVLDTPSFGILSRKNSQVEGFLKN